MSILRKDKYFKVFREHTSSLNDGSYIKAGPMGQTDKVRYDNMQVNLLKNLDILSFVSLVSLVSACAKEQLSGFHSLCWVGVGWCGGVVEMVTSNKIQSSRHNCHCVYSYAVIILFTRSH